MKRLLMSYVVLWTVIGGLVAWIFFHPSPAPIIDEGTRAQVRALRATHLADSLRIDSLVRSAAVSETRADLAVARARAVEAAGAVEGRRADSLARLARITDSGAIGQSDRWHQAYDARTAERDSLFHAVSLRDSADAAHRVALRDVHLALDSSEARRQRLEVVNNNLWTAVEKAERGCRVAHWFPCPSRTATGITGLILGSILGVAASK